MEAGAFCAKNLAFKERVSEAQMAPDLLDVEDRISSINRSAQGWRRVPNPNQYRVAVGSRREMREGTINT